LNLNSGSVRAVVQRPKDGGSGVVRKLPAMDAEF
jgi:hypothetical protein